MIIPIIFLDTNILWRDYLSYLQAKRNRIKRWYYGSSKPITFTKCVYEIWGLGKNVTYKAICENDSEAIKKLKNMEEIFINEFPFLHVGNRVIGKSDAFSLYEMTEYHDIDEPWLLHPLSRPRLFPMLDKKTLTSIKKFYNNYSQFRYDFSKFLETHEIREFSYFQVFGKDISVNIQKECIHFGGLLEHLNIPSEDIEIALAAISGKAAYFISEDKKLIKNWRSIGLNTHYPQPILLEIENMWRFSKDDIVIQWECAGFDSNELWLKKFLDYTESNPKEFM